jgi:uracil-DNA glycosylase
LKELTRHSECISFWLNLSEGKRSDSGWYFRQIDNCKYVVGYFSPKGNLEITEYLNEIEACAAFIKREIEAILNS